MNELKEIKQNVFYSSETTVELNRDSYEWLIKQVEKNQKEITDREDSHIQLYHRMTVAEDKAQELEKANEDLYDAFLMCRSVLQYYANDENYTYQEREIKWGESITHFKQSEIEKDRGERARKILSNER